MSDATAKPWGKRIGIAIAVLLVMAVGGGGLYKLRRSSNPLEKRKRVVTKDRESWVAKDKIALTKVGSNPSPECEEALVNTEEVVRFLQHACNQGDGEEKACEELAESLPVDFQEQSVVRGYYHKAQSKKYESPCNKGEGDVEACKNLADFLPTGSREEKLARKYYYKAQVKKYDPLCNKGRGDVQACKHLVNFLPMGSYEQSLAREYHHTLAFKKYDSLCNKGEGDVEACEHLAEASYLLEEKQAHQHYYKAAAIKNYGLRCRKGEGESQACRDLAAVLPQDSDEHNQALEYYQKAKITEDEVPCDKGEGDPQACKQLAASLPWGSLEQRQAFKYYEKAGRKKYESACAQGEGEIEACREFFASSLLSVGNELQHAWEYHLKAVRKKYEKPCIEQMDPQACANLYNALNDNSAEKKKIWHYWLNAIMSNCLDKNNIGSCEVILLVNHGEPIPEQLKSKAAHKLLEVCLIEHQYSACSPVMQHYRHAQPQCFEPQALTEQIK